jgi:hypothetical protein
MIQTAVSVSISTHHNFYNVANCCKALRENNNCGCGSGGFRNEIDSKKATSTTNINTLYIHLDTICFVGSLNIMTLANFDFCLSSSDTLIIIGVCSVFKFTKSFTVDRSIVYPYSKPFEVGLLLPQP